MRKVACAKATTVSSISLAEEKMALGGEAVASVTSSARAWPVCAFRVARVVELGRGFEVCRG